MDAHQFQAMVAGYLEAAAHADAPEGCTAEFSSEARAQALQDCTDFVTAAGPLVTQALALVDYNETQLGRDFWFSRRGHGVGFWDRNQLDTEAVSCPVFTDRDGKAYRACPEGENCTLGDALHACAYGTQTAISRWAYRSDVYEVDGELHFE